MSRSQPVAGPTISLFPFLAVLLCTMGALLVLLVLFSRAAKQGANRVSTAQAAVVEQAEEELALEKESLSWRLDHVKVIRGKTAEDLAKARMQLAGIEEHVRSLADELKSLERKAAALASADPSKKIADEEIERLEATLKSAKESLDEMRQKMASKPAAYAVVPYVGSAGTHRRPLYVECCIDGVFLQPEGIRLGPGDFEGPPGPGNPLASALRAAREHIASTTGSNGDPVSQPYPLLLVRPSGVMAYYAAREAIQSWGSEFGYQLIDEDWTLTFPPRDVALAEVERRAVEESRERLAWLMARKPSRPAKAATQYRAATTRGGVVSNSGPSLLGDQSQWDWSRQQAARGINGGDGDGSGAGDGSGTGGGPGRTLGTAGGSVLGSGSRDGGTGSGEKGNGREGSLVARPFRGGSGTSDEADGAADGVESDQTGSRLASGAAGGAGNASGGLVGGPVGAAARRHGVAPGGTDGRSTEMAGVSGGETSGRYAGGSAFTGSQGGGSSGGSSSGPSSPVSGATASGGAAGGGGPALPGMRQSGGALGSPNPGASGASVSMAGSRGRNWASLATADRPVPLTRPIHIECSLHELRLFDDSGRRVTTRIPLGADTADSIDSLVQAVHGRVAGWGLAGDRMYWNPQLVLSETADGRSRREDIERLLIDSGLETRCKEAGDVIRPLPPVQPRSAMLAPP